MLDSILRWLAGRGHDCRVNVPGEPYTWHGVKVSQNIRDLDGSHMVFTHLDRTNEAEVLCEAVPLVHLVHNESTLGVFNVHKRDLIVHNSEWIARLCPAERSVIVHPPVFAADYKVKPGRCITLINLNEAKGARLFWELAYLMPDQQFLAVKGGYGVQIVESAPNVTVMEQTADMREVYAKTRVLLMPSTYESYGRCAIEAACSAIPTVANGTPGLREALGKAGTYPATLDAQCWERAIRRMDWPAKSRQAKARFDSLDPESELLALEDALYVLGG